MTSLRNKRNDVLFISIVIIMVHVKNLHYAFPVHNFTPLLFSVNTFVSLSHRAPLSEGCLYPNLQRCSIVGVSTHESSLNIWLGFNRRVWCGKVEVLIVFVGHSSSSSYWLVNIVLYMDRSNRKSLELATFWRKWFFKHLFIYNTLTYLRLVKYKPGQRNFKTTPKPNISFHQSSTLPFLFFPTS